jgi:UDP-N-acetylmuramoylalanine-D-glutamate ligase
MSDIDTLLDELSSFQFSTTTTARPVPRGTPTNITEDNINDYILQKTGTLIDAGLGAVSDLKDFVVQGQNPDEIAALSELISSTTKAIEALNKINLQNKKAKTDKELKAIDIEGKKAIAGSLPGNITNNTLNLVASREEIFKQLLNDVKEETIEVIDSVVLEENDNK